MPTTLLHFSNGPPPRGHFIDQNIVIITVSEQRFGLAFQRKLPKSQAIKNKKLFSLQPASFFGAAFL